MVVATARTRPFYISILDNGAKGLRKLLIAVFTRDWGCVSLLFACFLRICESLLLLLQNLVRWRLRVFDIHNFGKARRPIAFAFNTVFKRVSLSSPQVNARSVGGCFSFVPLYFYYIISLLEGNLAYYLHFWSFPVFHSCRSCVGIITNWWCTPFVEPRSSHLSEAEGRDRFRGVHMRIQGTGERSTAVQHIQQRLGYHSKPRRSECECQLTTTLLKQLQSPRRLPSASVLSTIFIE